MKETVRRYSKHQLEVYGQKSDYISNPTYKYSKNFHIKDTIVEVIEEVELDLSHNILQRVKTHLSTDHRFFEVKFLTEVTKDQLVMIGLNPLSDYDQVVWDKDWSIRYSSAEGGIYVCGAGVRSDNPFGNEGDVVTIYLEAGFKSSNLINFYLNGHLVYRQWIDVKQEFLYPTIGISKGSAKFKIHWPGRTEKSSIMRTIAKGQSSLNDWIGFKHIKKDDETQMLEVTEHDHVNRKGYNLQAPRPLDCTNSYFEVELLTRVNPDFGPAIGLTSAWTSRYQYPGWTHDTIGYHSDEGSFYNDDGFKPSIESDSNLKCETGDRIGCGVVFSKKDHRESQLVTVYFTKNKQVIYIKPRMLPLGGFYPTVGMYEPGEKIKIENPCKDKCVKLSKEELENVKQFERLYQEFKFHESISFDDFLSVGSTRRISMPYKTKTAQMVHHISRASNLYLIQFQVIELGKKCEIFVRSVPRSYTRTNRYVFNNIVLKDVLCFSQETGLSVGDKVFVTIQVNITGIQITAVKDGLIVGQSFAENDGSSDWEDQMPTIGFQNGRATLDVIWPGSPEFENVKNNKKSVTNYINSMMLPPESETEDELLENENSHEETEKQDENENKILPLDKENTKISLEESPVENKDQDRYQPKTPMPPNNRYRKKPITLSPEEEIVISKDGVSDQDNDSGIIQDHNETNTPTDSNETGQTGSVQSTLDKQNSSSSLETNKSGDNEIPNSETPAPLKETVQQESVEKIDTESTDASMSDSSNKDIARNQTKIPKTSSKKKHEKELAETPNDHCATDSLNDTSSEDDIGKDLHSHTTSHKTHATRSSNEEIIMKSSIVVDNDEGNIDKTKTKKRKRADKHKTKHDQSNKSENTKDKDNSCNEIDNDKTRTDEQKKSDRHKERKKRTKDSEIASSKSIDVKSKEDKTRTDKHKKPDHRKDRKERSKDSEIVSSSSIEVKSKKDKPRTDKHKKSDKHKENKGRQKDSEAENESSSNDDSDRRRIDKQNRSSKRNRHKESKHKSQNNENEVQIEKNDKDKRRREKHEKSNKSDRHKDTKDRSHNAEHGNTVPKDEKIESSETRAKTKDKSTKKHKTIQVQPQNYEKSLSDNLQENVPSQGDDSENANTKTSMKSTKLHQVIQVRPRSNERKINISKDESPKSDRTKMTQQIMSNTLDRNMSLMPKIDENSVTLSQNGSCNKGDSETTRVTEPTDLVTVDQTNSTHVEVDKDGDSVSQDNEAVRHQIQTPMSTNETNEQIQLQTENDASSNKSNDILSEDKNSEDNNTIPQHDSDGEIKSPMSLNGTGEQLQPKTQNNTRANTSNDNLSEESDIISQQNNGRKGPKTAMKDNIKRKVLARTNCDKNKSMFSDLVELANFSDDVNIDFENEEEFFNSDNEQETSFIEDAEPSTDSNGITEHETSFIITETSSDLNDNPEQEMCSNVNSDDTDSDLNNDNANDKRLNENTEPNGENEIDICSDEKNESEKESSFEIDNEIKNGGENGALLNGENDKETDSNNDSDTEPCLSDDNKSGQVCEEESKPCSKICVIS